MIRILLLTSTLICGCASVLSRYTVVSDLDGGPVYITEKAIPDTRAFQIYSSQLRNDAAKMRYLINLTRESERDFIRNDQVLPGYMAAMGFDFKFKKHHDEAGDIEKFISNIGTFSKKTGKLYYVVLPDNRICKMSTAMQNEIERLKAYEAHQSA